MFFKKKKPNEDLLKRALDLGLISKGEFLRLKSDRADALLKEYFSKKKSK